MYKAFLLILCWVVCTPTVGAQGRAPQSSPPSSTLQKLRDAIRTMTPEQRDWLRAKVEQQRARELEASLLERARAPRAVPTPEQRPLHWPFGSSTVVPIGPIPTLSDLPAIEYGDWGVSGLKGFESNDWLWSKADSAKIDRAVEGILPAVEDIVELDRINRYYAASNPPPVPYLADHKLPLLPSASAASHVSSIRLNVEKNRVMVRANRNGFPIGTLFEDDDFVAKYRDGKKIYVEGHAEGNVQKPGWVKFKDTFGLQDPPAHTAPKSHILLGDDSKRYLLNNYAFVINDEHSQPSPARITMPTPAYQNYTNGIPLDPLNRQLLPYDPINNPRKFAWRWITDDGKYVMGRECRYDPKEKKCVEGAPTYWVYVRVCAVAIPGYSFPCQ